VNRSTNGRPKTILVERRCLEEPDRDLLATDRVTLEAPKRHTAGRLLSERAYQATCWRRGIPRPHGSAIDPHVRCSDPGVELRGPTTPGPYAMPGNWLLSGSATCGGTSECTDLRSVHTTSVHGPSTQAVFTGCVDRHP